MTQVSIREFVEPARICLQPLTVAAAIELMVQDDLDRLVLVNEQQHPIGLIQLRRLLPHRNHAAELDLSVIDELPWIEDTIAIEHLQFSNSTRHWAVVNVDRQFIGLVDSFYLRRLVGSIVTEAPRQLASEVLWHRSDSTPGCEQAHLEMARLQHKLQVQIGELGYGKGSDNPACDITPRDPKTTLMQFLEHLPLPLMLQTDAGEAIAQNSIWVEQFGDLVDPGWVQRDAAAVLEFAGHAMVQPASARLCHLGATPNTCICVCPFKNGQERTIQFVKIPLGTLLSGHASVCQTHRDPNQAAFRLARFEQATLTAGLTRSTGESFWLVLAQDVTEQQQLARELAAKNADLIQLNRLKDEFLACISHELRTPLTAVLGLSSLLKDQLSGTLNDRQVRYAHLIHRSGRHLMAIVNDILDLTRIETGQIELTLDPVNIRSVCDRAIKQAQQLCLEEHKLDRTEIHAATTLPAIGLDIEPGLETLIADELRLRQMLLHLLSNALKFTETTGKIGLKVSRWEGWINFTVWDTGIGIPTEKQHLIFQKFQQLENPMTRRFEGAGLGLVLTQRLVRLHGGDVSFVSRENQGSQFTLLLPPTYPQPTVAINYPTPVPNRLVLVVEAVVRSIEQLSEQLAELGYRVVIARSGTEAVEKARRLQPCAVLVNPLLPTLSGWDVLTLLKAEPTTYRIPIVMIGTQSDRDPTSRYQADGFLNFPIALGSLKQVLARLTANEDPVEETAIANLVILRLSPTRYNESQHVDRESNIDLNALLHSHNYRVIEADDLEQAELLAQVWKPNLVLLDAAVPDPANYLKQFGDCAFLSALPLVTLDSATTQAANQVAGLSVFPCLAPLIEQSISAGRSETSALLQVIQVAAGFAWRPLVLAIDSTKLVDQTGQSSSGWLQAVMQYFQTAGFRGCEARSWSEVLQKLETHSVDLLLLHWHDDLDETALARLSQLKSLKRPPIVVIQRQRSIEPFVREIATQILPPLSMEELLEHVNQILTQ